MPKHQILVHVYLTHDSGGSSQVSQGLSLEIANRKMLHI